MAEHESRIGKENVRYDKFFEKKNKNDLYKEIMVIDKNLMDSMVAKPSDESDGQEMKLQISIDDELQCIKQIIYEEYSNQKQQVEHQKNNVSDQMSKTKNLIEKIFNKNKTTIFNSEITDNQYIVTFKMLDHFDHFLDLCVIKLKKDQLKCTIHFCRENYEPVIIPDKITRAQCARFFIRKLFKIGGFVINPLSGQITFSYATLNNFSKYTGNEFDEFLNRVIKSIFTSAYHMINYQFLSLAAKIGILSIPIYKELESMVKSYNKSQTQRCLYLPDNMITRLNNTVDLLENCVIPFSDFFNNKSLKISEEDRNDIRYELDIFKNANRNGSDRESQLEPFKIYEFDDTKKKRISGGGFSDIYIVDLQFQLKIKANNNYYGFQENHSSGNSSGTFALKILRKELESRDSEKVEKEVRIINEIKPKCKYVAKYFYDESKKDHLYMEIYYFTLGSYAHFHNSVLSLNTRLNLTLQVAQGVYFLQKTKIFHLDLKPPNILIDDDCCIKICDFGESYSQSIHKEVKNFQKTGRTLPYSPIEAIEGKYLSTASDIYSIGAIISEIVFDKRLIEFKRINQQKLQQKLISRNYRLIYSDLVVKEFGIKQIMKILKVLMLKCVNPDPLSRPHIEYIIAILHMLIKVLNDVF